MADGDQVSDVLVDGGDGLVARSHAREAGVDDERAAEGAAAVRARAEAEAEALRAKSAAEAEALRAQANAEALRENHEAILGRELIGQVPALMAEFAKGYQNVGTVTLVGGDTAGTHIAREQAAGLTATSESVKSATGVDLGAILQGQAFGRGMASSREAESVPRGND